MKNETRNIALTGHSMAIRGAANDSQSALYQTLFTQRELAERFRVSQSTIINWRNRGLLRYLKLPGSSRVLYPVDAIQEFEQQQIVYEKEVMKNNRSRGKRSKISTITEWRIS